MIEDRILREAAELVRQAATQLNEEIALDNIRLKRLLDIEKELTASLEAQLKEYRAQYSMSGQMVEVMLTRLNQEVA